MLIDIIFTKTVIEISDIINFFEAYSPINSIFTIINQNLSTTQFRNDFQLNAKFKIESTKLKISVISKEVNNIL